ncbi:hypothetical protein A2714_04615 [Candidatus Woesebacteria bacterium RIFCSPHIGHO2_01_FULL_38_9]|uniref:Aminoglycoside phosphotransferase domain-containing protein n=2 Tax=Candidatus Woeseibacteriota TaxID=1752722 RepID=A0A1F7Y3S8_9BACT|nr:MAG: hypothetical protein A2714_04615 [Candidatus Woesebacteria bacterium RIFCSPHIGHO2_01_FULL_38_9]OGM60278.1 MAG: hypothetical protein A3A75_04180 [Candidatus Woesebacteria bacterium RIFCSPLOWO2_01_FULL_39_10]
MKANISSEVDSIPEIISFFGLSAPLTIYPIGDGVANHNYAVRTVQGEFVVKFLVAQSVESIENDIAIQKQLNEAGISTPEYLQSEQDMYIFNAHNLIAVVSQKIDGVIPREVNIKLANDFGRKLATFHENVVQLPHPNKKGLMNPAVSGINSSIFSLSLPKGIIHGDFHLGNVLVDQVSQDQIVAVLDFEEAGENLFVVDLAVTVMGVCSSTDGYAVDIDLIQKVIKGYNSTRNLSDLEKTHFTEAVRYSAETWIKWFKENNYEKYAEKHKKRLESFTELVSMQSLFIIN